MRALALVFLIGCGSPRPPVPDPPPAAAPLAITPAAAATPAAPIAWRWDAVPDLYPLLDLTVEHAGHRFVLALAAGKDNDWQRAVTLRGPTWSVEVARSGHVGGAAMVADDDRVYVATYNRIAAGCSLAAFAAGTGALLWSLPLDGIGPIGHSKYSNRVQLRLVNGHPVVFGSEARRYIEERDPATGALLSHQLFDPAYPPAPIGEPLYWELDHMLATQASYTVRVDDFLARHVAMTDADHAARGAAFAEAVHQLDGLAIDRGAYTLHVQLVEVGADFEVRATRARP